MNIRLNCYGEFVETIEPTDVGADMIVGSLIKNPGGGLAPIGGYIVGRKDCIERASYRLSAPGLGKEVGASLGLNQQLYQGLFLSPVVVSGALKGAIFAASIYVISHQERIIQLADEIVLLRDGKVAETGTPEELMPKLGFVAKGIPGCQLSTPTELHLTEIATTC